MAEIIELPLGLDVAKHTFLEIIEERQWTPEATKWIQGDAWPRVKDLIRSQRDLTIDGIPGIDGIDDAIAAINEAIKDVMENNRLGFIAQILKLERELYEVRFGKSVHDE